MEFKIKELTIEKLDEILTSFLKDRKPITQEQFVENCQKNMSPTTIEYFNNLVKEEAKNFKVESYLIKKKKVTNKK
jgi:hypothetical protein